MWFPQIPIILIDWELSLIRLPFGHLFTALIASFSASFRSRAALPLEILALRHQLGVLQRSVKLSKLTPADRLLWAWLRIVWQDWQSGVFIMKASTVLGWHRKGFRLFWRWEIRHGKPGRPAVPKEIRELIRMMSRENPLRGRSLGLRRTAQARHRDRRNQRQQIHGPPPETIPDLEDVPRESRKKYGVGGLLRRADDPVPDPVRVSGAGA
jgi:hypothetical protein